MSKKFVTISSTGNTTHHRRGANPHTELDSAMAQARRRIKGKLPADPMMPYPGAPSLGADLEHDDDDDLETAVRKTMALGKRFGIE